MTSAAQQRFASDVGPPIWPFVVDGLAVTASAVLLWFPMWAAGPADIHLVGWLCGAILPICCQIGYRLQDRVRRRLPNYVVAVHRGTLLAVLTAVGVGFGGCHAWLFAHWWAS